MNDAGQGRRTPPVPGGHPAASGDRPPGVAHRHPGRPAGDAPSRGQGGRPRRAETDEAILDATLRLLRQRGPRGVTVEAAAAESGVAKTTIYRRYRDRSALLEAAMSRVADLPAPPPDLPVREQLIFFLEQFRAGLDRGTGLRAIAALLAPHDDVRFTDTMRTTVIRPRLQQILDIFGAGVDAGALRPDADYRRVTQLLLGSYFAQAVLEGVEAIDAGWSATVVDLVLPGILAHP